VIVDIEDVEVDDHKYCGKQQEYALRLKLAGRDELL
jgi:hypothetical protein